MIPPEKTASVTRALREAFGVSEFEDIRPVTGGHTNSLVFRIVVNGSPYLLKIIIRTGDCTRHYQSMQAAAEAGVSPRVWYTSVEDRISITDFVRAIPLPAADALVRIPAVLRTLHALPPFAPVPYGFNTTCTFLLDRGPAVEGFLQRFRAAKLLPETEGAGFFACYEQIAAVYPRHESDLVSSHNDLFKPDNMLFDGSRIWFVDWEAAFRNDRYADLAVVANLLVTNDAEERIYLEEYFGAPDSYQLARYYLARQLSHIFYTMAFLLIGSAGKPVDWSDPIPEFTEYNRQMWAGGVDLADPHTKVLYGKVHWQRLQQNLRHPRFDEALAIVADRHAIPSSAGPA